MDEVDNSSLLDVLVFSINSIILKLFFGVSQVSVLSELNRVSPLVGQLLEFILGVYVVEH